MSVRSREPREAVNPSARAAGLVARLLQQPSRRTRSTALTACRMASCRLSQQPSGRRSRLERAVAAQIHAPSGGIPLRSPGP
jgi:hypothetical protein